MIKSKKCKTLLSISKDGFVELKTFKNAFFIRTTTIGGSCSLVSSSCVIHT